ncbi:MAG: VOC family protein [Chloroflexota bacterium]|nr:VOC family protein [Chloroflexota bacterium]
MEIGGFAINLTSEDPQRLMQFYKEVVGLPPQAEMGDGALKVGGATLFIDGHSDTKGGAKEPQRVLINFFISDLPAEQKRLETAGAKFIRKEGKEPWGGVISTFTDPDGNYCQLIEYKG